MNSQRWQVVFLSVLCAGCLAAIGIGAAQLIAQPSGSPAVVARPVCCMAMIGVSHDTITMAQICTDYRVHPDTNRSPVS